MKLGYNDHFMVILVHKVTPVKTNKNGKNGRFNRVLLYLNSWLTKMAHKTLVKLTTFVPLRQSKFFSHSLKYVKNCFDVLKSSFYHQLNSHSIVSLLTLSIICNKLETIVDFYIKIRLHNVAKN